MSTTTTRSFPFVRLDGTPRDAGQQYGEQCRAGIRARTARLRDQLAATTTLSWDAARSDLDLYAGLYERYCPHVLAEMEGIAAGAGIDQHEALLLRTCWELLADHRSSGCTTFIASGKHTRSGNMIGGQNKDVPARQKAEVVIVEMHSGDGRPAMLNYAYFGMCEGPGMNGAGLMKFENALHIAPETAAGNARRRADAVPMHLLKRLIQESSSAAECEQWLQRIRDEGHLQGSGTLCVGDATGRVVAFELAGSDFCVYDAENGMLSHANHTLHPDLQARDRIRDNPQWVDSLTRQPRMAELMQARDGTLDADYAARAMLADRANGPGSICRRQDYAESVAGIVCEPATGQMMVSHGLPSDGHFTTYHLENDAAAVG